MFLTGTVRPPRRCKVVFVSPAQRGHALCALEGRQKPRGLERLELFTDGSAQWSESISRLSVHPAPLSAIHSVFEVISGLTVFTEDQGCVYSLSVLFMVPSALPGQWGLLPKGLESCSK